MENKNWTPTQEDNLGIITRVYESIKEEPFNNKIIIFLKLK